MPFTAARPGTRLTGVGSPLQRTVGAPTPGPASPRCIGISARIACPAPGTGLAVGDGIGERSPAAKPTSRGLGGRHPARPAWEPRVRATAVPAPAPALLSHLTFPAVRNSSDEKVSEVGVGKRRGRGGTPGPEASPPHPRRRARRRFPVSRVRGPRSSARKTVGSSPARASARASARRADATAAGGGDAGQRRQCPCPRDLRRGRADPAPTPAVEN